MDLWRVFYLFVLLFISLAILLHVFIYRRMRSPRHPESFMKVFIEVVYHT